MDKHQISLLLIVVVGFGLEFSGIANSFARRRLFGIGPGKRVLIALGLGLVVYAIALIGE